MTSYSEFFGYGNAPSFMDPEYHNNTLPSEEITRDFHANLRDNDFQALLKHLKHNLDVKLSWKSKPDGIITVTGLEDAVNAEGILSAIRKFDKNARPT